MKNIILSTLVIAMTITCVWFMLSERDIETTNEIQVNQIFEDNKKLKVENVSKTEEKKENTKTKVAKEVERKDINSIGIKKPETNTGKVKKSGSEEIIVFKVPKGELLTSISKEDKIKLMAIMDKISPSDYARINNYSKLQIENSDIINIMRILKTRLSREDYYEIRDIAAKYIYIEKLEKIIET